MSENAQNIAVLTKSKHRVITTQCLLSLSLSLRQKASPPDSSQGGSPKPEGEVRWPIEKKTKKGRKKER